MWVLDFIKTKKETNKQRIFSGKRNSPFDSPPQNWNIFDTCCDLHFRLAITSLGKAIWMQRAYWEEYITTTFLVSQAQEEMYHASGIKFFLPCEYSWESKGMASTFQGRQTIPYSLLWSCRHIYPWKSPRSRVAGLVATGCLQKEAHVFRETYHPSFMSPERKKFALCFISCNLLFL